MGTQFGFDVPGEARSPRQEDYRSAVRDLREQTDRLALAAADIHSNARTATRAPATSLDFLDEEWTDSARVGLENVVKLATELRRNPTPQDYGQFIFLLEHLTALGSMWLAAAVDVSAEESDPEAPDRFGQRDVNPFPEDTTAQSEEGTSCE